MRTVRLPLLTPSFVTRQILVSHQKSVMEISKLGEKNHLILQKKKKKKVFFMLSGRSSCLMQKRESMHLTKSGAAAKPGKIVQ